MANQPLISLIIPTYNNVATIERCLRSLCDQDWPLKEILVIDDASTDGTFERLKAFDPGPCPLRIFRLDRQSGAAAARNCGFLEAQGKLIALIDGDMWAPSEWLSLLVAPLLAGEAEVTGGPDKVPPQSELISRCIGYSMDSILTNAGLRLGHTRLVTYLPGTGNMAILTSVLRGVGGFDEGFFDTGEDKEWLYRIRASGARLTYLPQALAWHERAPDVWLHAKKQLLSGRRRLDIVLKDPASFEWPHFAPSLLLIFLISVLAFPLLRPLGLWIWALGVGLVVADAFYGAFQLGDVRAIPILMFTSPCIPLGYGFGVLIRGVEVLINRCLRR